MTISDQLEDNIMHVRKCIDTLDRPAGTGWPAESPRTQRTRNAAEAIETLIALFDRLAGWQQRARQRRELRRMSDRELKDIGLSRVDAEREAAKPFWRK
jgi:uncharacterized protein YjiS (DUF1127 family)